MKKVLIFGFPIFLLLFELILRKCLGLKSYNFMGPCLATAGLSMLISLTIPKSHNFKITEVEDKRTGKLKKPVVMDPGDSALIDIAWIFVFVMILSWSWTLYLSAQSTINYWWELPDFIVVGLANYFIALILSVIKEVL